MTVRWKDQTVALTLTEFWMMHALARYPGHVKNRQQLMDAAQAVLDDNTITSHIKSRQWTRSKRACRILLLLTST